MKIILVFFFSFFTLFGFSQLSQTLTTSGSFIVPCGVTSLTVECWGAGGAGGAAQGNTGGGGGGAGGAYAYRVIPVTSGASIAYIVGLGGVAASNIAGPAGSLTSFSTNVIASGGAGGALNTVNNASSAGATGSTAGSSGSVLWAGGNGGTGVGGASAGGGGEAGAQTIAGNNGGVTTAGAGAGAGGDGGNGGTTGGTGGVGNAGNIPGGGGGGGRAGNNTDRRGGNGAPGQIVVSYANTAANAGLAQGPCTSSVTLAGNTVSGFTGAWTCIANCGGVTIVTPTSATSQVTGLVLNTATTLQWTLTYTATGCTSSSNVVITRRSLCNDEPTGATALPVSATCSFSTFTNAGATNSTCGTIGAPSCGFYTGPDVWFSFTVPASGNVSIQTQVGTMTDPQMSVYSGTPCGVMTEVGCSDDNPGTGTLEPLLSLTGQTPGATLYIRMSPWNASGDGTFSICLSSPPCEAATTLIVDAALTCNQNTQNSAAVNGECLWNGVGISQTRYYRFTATNDSLVLNFDFLTNASGVFPGIIVYGPFAPGAGCNPACGSNIYFNSYGTGVPVGNHILLTGLAISGNHDYLVQIEGTDNFPIDYCIGVANPAYNNTKFVPSFINNCGTTFNGTTAQGYFPSSATPNFDANNATACGACPAGTYGIGADVPFTIDNDSWFKFCTVGAATFNVQFKVISCLFPAGTGGLQMAVLTGTTTAFANTWTATNPTLPTTALQTSTNFALAAGGCAYLVVDGWNGDACSYSYVLTNVSGGCVLLPIELLAFNAIQKEKTVELNWATATEINNDYFSIERADDAVNFKLIETVKGAGTTANAMFYSSVDYSPLPGLSYYRLKQTDYDGKSTYSNIISVNYINDKDLKFDIVPNPIAENQTINIRLGFIPKHDVSVLIYDINGLLIYEATKKIDSPNFEIPKEFSKGMYLVKIICDEFVETKRMIIK